MKEYDDLLGFLSSIFNLIASVLVLKAIKNSSKKKSSRRRKKK